MNYHKQKELDRCRRILEHRKTLARREHYTIWATIGIVVLATLYFIL